MASRLPPKSPSPARKPPTPTQKRAVAAKVARPTPDGRPSDFVAELIQPKPCEDFLDQLYHRIGVYGDAGFDMRLHSLPLECKERGDVLGLCRYHLVLCALNGCDPITFVPRESQERFAKALEEAKCESSLPKKASKVEFFARVRAFDLALAKATANRSQTGSGGGQTGKRSSDARPR